MLSPMMRTRKAKFHSKKVSTQSKLKKIRDAEKKLESSGHFSLSSSTFQNTLKMHGSVEKLPFS